jgi:hypothetical protein
MKKVRKKNKYLLLASLLLLISLGYAVLSSNLRINGFSRLNNSTWDIHFDNVDVKNGSVSLKEGDSPATITPADNTEVTFSVSLDKPGDYYEFEVDAVNEGSIDGMVNLTSTTITIGDETYTNEDLSNLPNYLDYSLTYSD